MNILKSKNGLIFLFLSGLLMFTSCVINIKGWKVDYDKLNEEDMKMVVITNPAEKICNLKNDNRIYAIQAQQLVECLNLSDSTLIYDWSANCHSESCISIPACQKYCAEHGLKLVVISEYYDPEIMRIQNFADLPIFVPNHIYYKTEKCSKLNSRFFNEVFQGKRPGGEHKYSRFHVFYKGKYVRSISKLL
jgi:hypothetical protein